MDWFVSDEFEFDAGGPTRRWARKVCALWSTCTSCNRSRRIHLNGNPRDTRILLVPQPERLSLHGPFGRHAARPAPRTRGDRTSGHKTHPDRHPDAPGLHPLLLALPNHDHLGPRTLSSFFGFPGFAGGLKP